MVALLAEGVDRNLLVPVIDRAFRVALLAEGVDRNMTLWLSKPRCRCRPPRGGRG